MLTISKDGFGSDYDDLGSEVQAVQVLPHQALVHTFAPKKLQTSCTGDGETPDLTVKEWPFGSNEKMFQGKPRKQQVRMTLMMIPY